MIPYSQYVDAYRYFVLHDSVKERSFAPSTFVEDNIDELIKLLRIWHDDVPPQQEELSADDTKELDEFLNSFVRK